MATFMYHFAEDRTVTSNVHFGAYEIDVSYKLGNMSNYVDANGIVGDQEWAMRVNSASWGYFPTNTTFDNDVAILASNFDFLAVPTPFYQEIEAFLTRNNFTCEEEYPSDDIICAIQSDCDVVAPSCQLSPSLSLTRTMILSQLIFLRHSTCLMWAVAKLACPSSTRALKTRRSSWAVPSSVQPQSN